MNTIHEFANKEHVDIFTSNDLQVNKHMISRVCVSGIGNNSNNSFFASCPIHCKIQKRISLYIRFILEVLFSVGALKAFSNVQIISLFSNKLIDANTTEVIYDVVLSNPITVWHMIWTSIRSQRVRWAIKTVSHPYSGTVLILNRRLLPHPRPLSLSKPSSRSGMGK